MKRASTRIRLLALAWIVVFEVLMQLTVGWRESSGELVFMLQTVPGI